MVLLRENVKIETAQINTRDMLYALATHAAVAICSFVAARAPVMGLFAPFGIAFAAGISKPYILTAGIGAAIGYFIPIAEGSAFRYFAALFAVCTIRLLLAGVGRFLKLPVFSALTAFAASLATSLATVASGGFSLLYAATESVFAAAGAYFVHRASVLLRRERTGFSPEQLACIVMTVNILLMGLYPVAPFGISLGRILAAVSVLAVARYSLASGGAIAGCVTSLFIMLCGGEFSSAAIIFAVGGLLCGVFAPLGKIPCAVIFVLWGGISALFLEQSAAAYMMLTESALGAAIFLLLPNSVCMRAGKLISPPANTPSLDGLRRALTMRLFFASDALSDVSETVTQVSNELSLINAPDFSWVLESVKSDSCRGCSLCSYCWERKKSATHDAILYMTKLIKGGDREPDRSAPDEFRDRCLRPARVGGAVVRYYDEYASRIAAETRIEEIRSIVSDQFDGISSMLFDLATEFEQCERFDSALAARIAGMLKDVDVRASDCACKIDKYDRMSIELRVSLPPSAVINRMDILRVIESVCERDFEAPTVTRAKNEAFIRLCEKANFTVELGVSQLICGNGAVCGDAYTTFNDGKGRSVMILSDGMGTGGRAAVDGAMASGLMERLLKAGFGYDCALRIVNSSLLFKSTDESLATLDIACIDLFTGKADLLKVGAAPTVIRRGGRTGKAQSTSLPAGILRDIGFDKAVVGLKAGDIVLMLSDGATSGGTDWICAELEAFRDGSAQQLADRIASAARRRRQDGHDDDITVIAAILERAV